MIETIKPKDPERERIIEPCQSKETDRVVDQPKATSAEMILIQAAIAGEQAARGRLYDRYAGLIRAVCHDATHDIHEAQDLCQEVFLRAFQRLGDLREQDRFAGWIVGIARMVSREWRRKATRERRRRSVLAGSSAVNPITNRDDGTEIDLLLGEIAKLPERERLALHLFYLQEQPVQDARTVMGLSRSGFYRVLDRARDRLRRALERKAVT